MHASGTCARLVLVTREYLPCFYLPMTVAKLKRPAMNIAPSLRIMNTVKGLFSFPEDRVQNDMLDSQELHDRVLTFRIRNR